MQVDVVQRGLSFRYRLRPDADDPDEGRRQFADCPTPFLLVNDEYRMVLPRAFKTLHPDAHALAIWYALRPVIGSRLELPFAVSERFAGWMLQANGVRLERVSAQQEPRRRPEPVVPSLLFSGGMDSMAASLLLPAGTHHLFLDRIPHRRPGEGRDALLDLVRQRAACSAVREDGNPVHRTADDHEHLFAPYPMWHSDMTLLPALYLADSLGLSTIDTGNVLDATYFGGYHAGGLTGWRMRPPDAMPGGAEPERERGDVLGAVGLSRAASIAGLSEVATTIVVARSRRRGKSFSCYYPTDGSFCMRCDKCFKKLLLRHIAEGEEVPGALFEGFLRIPYLAAIFARPYFDWHHVWFYLFQNLKCRHWFARELHRQARKGPDLSALEKWYPKAASEMEPAYAEAVRDNIARVVPIMSAAEMRRLETVEIPPLHAPPLKGMSGGAAAAPAGPPPGGGAGYPAETKALFRMLKAKLPKDEGPWGGWRIGEVYLRNQDPGVCLRLLRNGEGATLRLFKITGPADKFLVRLGSLGLACASERPPDRKVVLGLARSLLAAFAQARQELAGA